MRGSFHHLILPKDRSRLISMVVDSRYVITSIEGDLGDLTIKVGMPLGPAKMLAKAMGYDVIPNQWETPFVSIKEEQGMFSVSVKAKHVLGETVSFSVSNPNLSDAKAMFWNRWNGEVAATGWHTHLYSKEGYKTA